MLLLKYDLHLPNCTTQVIVNNNIKKKFSWKTHISEIFLFLFFIKKYSSKYLKESDLALIAIGYLKNSFFSMTLWDHFKAWLPSTELYFLTGLVIKRSILLFYFRFSTSRLEP
jgi:hypothetical protein